METRVAHLAADVVVAYILLTCIYSRIVIIIEPYITVLLELLAALFSYCSARYICSIARTGDVPVIFRVCRHSARGVRVGDGHKNRRSAGTGSSDPWGSRCRHISSSPRHVRANEYNQQHQARPST